MNHNHHQHQTNGRHALIIDNDIELLEQMESGLKKAGMTVTRTESENEAETLVSQVKPDIVILELMLDHQDAGFVISHKIKQRFPKMPVILLSSALGDTGISFEPSSDEERSWIKADVMLDKPVRFEQLLMEIDRLIVP